jgi:hypothetical protein
MLSWTRVTITTIAAAQAAAEGIHAIQLRQTTVYALQQLHAATGNVTSGKKPVITSMAGFD